MAKRAPITEAVKQQAISGRRAKWWRRTGHTSRTFKYFDANGKQITNKSDLERINSLVIPPAWQHVRISPAAHGRIRAVGVDGSGRLQYIYDPKYAAAQQRKKFAKIERFGEYLPKIREATNEHLRLDGFPREKVLAIMLRLINSLYIRVGSEKSEKRYRTYGITTLKNKHLTVTKKGELIFEFVGKSHVHQRTVLVDEELAELMKRLRSLGTSRKLFHYVNGDGQPHVIRPADINSYLKELTAPEFSSKDFRTWGATFLAATELAEIGVGESETEIKKNVVKVVKKVAERLGNTPSVCRSSYIHPTVIKAYEQKVVIEIGEKGRRRRTKHFQSGFEPEEEALLKLFRNF